MTVESIVYDPGGLTEYDDPATAKGAEGTTWVRAHRADQEQLDAVADAFGIHALAVEDVSNGVRPKVEEFSTFTFALVKTAELARGETTFEEEIHEESVGVFVGGDWIVSMATGPDEPVDRIWAAVRRGDDRLLQRGADFTAYRIVDAVVDEYFVLLDRIEDQIEVIEEAVLVSTGIETVEAINGVRRDLLSFRRLAWPMREAVGSLARGDPEHVREPTEKYFRDVYDHLVQAVELTEIYRDLASGARDIYLNTVSQSTNEVMKVLTVVATIFLPLTFVVGIYGMNFEGGAVQHAGTRLGVRLPRRDARYGPRSRDLALVLPGTGVPVIGRGCFGLRTTSGGSAGPGPGSNRARTSHAESFASRPSGR